MLTIHEAAEIAWNAAEDPQRWESIVIDRREPHTHRAILTCGDSRICLHRFEPCEAANSFAHPHAWPSSMLVLAGEYDMVVSRSDDLESAAPVNVISLTLGPGSIYHMTERQTWHQVIPRSQCYSLMVNGPRWSEPHRRAPSTAGKGLLPMEPPALVEHLRHCRDLLSRHLKKASH